MSAGHLSPVGGYCYYVNALVGIGILSVPKAFSAVGIPWMGVFILTFAAVFSLIAARQMLKITDLLYAEVPEKELTEGLIFKPPEERTYEIDIPNMFKGVITSRPLRDILYYSSFFFSLIYLVELIVNYTHFFALNLLTVASKCRDCGNVDASTNNWHYILCVLGFAVVMTLMSACNFKQMEKLQICMTICRGLFVLLIIWTSRIVGTQAAERSKSVSDVLWNAGIQFPLLLLILQYQIPIPSILVASDQSPAMQDKVHSWAVFTAYFICLILGLFCPTPEDKLIPHFQERSFGLKPESFLYTLTWLGYLIFPAITTLSCAHIFWRTFGGLLIAWRYGSNLRLAKEMYQRKTLFVYIFAPWPIYLIILSSFVDKELNKVKPVDHAAFIILTLIFGGIPFCYAKALALYRQDTGLRHWVAKLSVYVLYCVALLCIGVSVYQVDDALDTVLKPLFEVAGVIAVGLISWAAVDKCLS